MPFVSPALFVQLVRTSADLFLQVSDGPRPLVHHSRKRVFGSGRFHRNRISCIERSLEVLSGAVSSKQHALSRSCVPSDEGTPVRRWVQRIPVSAQVLTSIYLFPVRCSLVTSEFRSQIAPSVPFWYQLRSALHFTIVSGGCLLENRPMNAFAIKLESQEESLKHLGLANLGQVYWDLPTSALYEEAIRRYEAALSHLGPIVMRTGQHTGRLPHDKFL